MATGPAAVSAGKMLSKRQINMSNPPMPQGDHFGRDRYNVPRWAMILMGVLLGVLLLITIAYCLITVLRRRKTKTTTSHIKAGISHQRSMSGISEDDPDSIKPVKRLRSFHMKGTGNVSSPDTMSPRTPKAKDGLFGRFFRKKEGHAPLAPLDEEKNESYESLNRYPDTPGLDQKMLEASPPPTPAPAFGWGSSAGSGQNKRRSMGGAEGVLGEQGTAYKGDTRPPLGQGERDSFLSTSSRGEAPSKRLSTDYNENYQSKPSGGYFDDDDMDEKKPLGYDPDSRSGH